MPFRLNPNFSRRGQLIWAALAIMLTIPTFLFAAYEIWNDGDARWAYLPLAASVLVLAIGFRLKIYIRD